MIRQRQIKLRIIGTACLTILYGCGSAPSHPSLDASPSPSATLSQVATVLACDTALLKRLGGRGTSIQAEPPDVVEGLGPSATAQLAAGLPRYHVLGGARVRAADGPVVIRKYTCTAEQRPTGDVKIDDFQLLP